MAAVVVDASTVVKWYIPERDHEPARALRDDYLDGRHDLVAPALLPFDVVNALTVSSHYDDDMVVDASNTLPEYGIELVPYRDAGPVARVAADLDVTISDASYLALANSTDSTVYTADSKLIEATERSHYLKSARESRRSRRA